MSLLNYLSFIAMDLVLLVVATLVYMRVTPYDELKLIRDGHASAALSLGGTIIGISLVISCVTALSHRMVDAVVWSAAALVLQILLFYGLHLVLRGFDKAISDGKVSYGILSCLLSISLGLLNAACLVG